MAYVVPIIGMATQMFYSGCYPEVCLPPYDWYGHFISQRNGVCPLDRAVGVFLPDELYHNTSWCQFQYFLLGGIPPLLADPVTMVVGQVFFLEKVFNSLLNSVGNISKGDVDDRTDFNSTCK